MRVALYGQSFKPDFVPSLEELFRKLDECGAEVHIYSPFAKHLEKHWRKPPLCHSTFLTHQEVDPGWDFFFCLGGDGTILDAVTLVRESQVPVVGINSGRLGFLATISKEEVGQAFEAIRAKAYTLEERSLIQVDTAEDLFGEFNYGMNELTLSKRDSASMITIQAYANGAFLNSYWADGLIVATPTGSTAYSLSAGGPIVMPGSKNFILTPLAPHNLTVRPLVVPDDLTLQLRVEGRDKHFLVALDHRSMLIQDGEELVLRKAPFGVRMVKPHDNDFFATLRNKLLWGLDKRN